MMRVFKEVLQDKEVGIAACDVRAHAEAVRDDVSNSWTCAYAEAVRDDVRETSLA